MQPMLFDHLPERAARRAPERARLERREARRQALIDNPPSPEAFSVMVALFDTRATLSPICEWLKEPACARWFAALRRAGLVRKTEWTDYLGKRHWVATRSL